MHAPQENYKAAKKCTAWITRIALQESILYRYAAGLIV